MHVELAQKHRASATKTLGCRGILHGDAMAESGAARRAGEPRDIDIVFNGDGNAIEGPRRLPSLEATPARLGIGERSVMCNRDECTQLRIALIDLSQQFLCDRDWIERTGAVGATELGDGQ